MPDQTTDATLVGSSADDVASAGTPGGARHGVGNRPIREVGVSVPSEVRVRALVFARRFYLGRPLEVLARLEATTTVRILDAVDDDVLSRPDEYYGYVIRYSFSTTGVYTFLFTEQFSERGRRYRLTGDVNYFSPELNLVASALEALDG